LEKRRAAMPAGIDECPDSPVVAADYDEGYADDAMREVIAGLLHIVGAADEIPAFSKNLRNFPAMELRRGIAGERQRLRFEQRLTDCAIALRVEEIHR